MRVSSNISSRLSWSQRSSLCQAKRAIQACVSVEQQTYGPKENHPSSYDEDPPFAAFKHINELLRSARLRQGDEHSMSM
jgi:hypothetical protein